MADVMELEQQSAQGGPAGGLLGWALETMVWSLLYLRTMSLSLYFPPHPALGCRIKWVAMRGNAGDRALSWIVDELN